MFSTIRDVLGCICWPAAFVRNGFGARQALVSDRVKVQLPPVCHLEAPSSRPPLVDLALCFPRRWVMNEVLLWPDAAVARPYLLLPSVRLWVGAAGAPRIALPPVVGEGIRELRTRAEHRAAAAAAAAPALAAPASGRARPPFGVPLPRARPVRRGPDAAWTRICSGVAVRTCRCRCLLIYVSFSVTFQSSRGRRKTIRNKVGRGTS